MFGNSNHEAKRMRNGRVKMMAVTWFARMRSNQRTLEDERRLKAWLEAAPEHEAAYAEVRRSFEAMGEVADLPEVVAMRRAARRPRHPALRLLTTPRPAVAAALAACLLLTVTLGMTGMLWPGWGGHNVYQTDAGERSTIALNDGTLVTLTSDTRLVVDFSSLMRRVRLERGEAYFEVMHDAERPFIVEAGTGAVTAIGTVFDVCKKNDGVVVTLIEGLVEVAALDKVYTDKKPVRLQAGEQVSLENGRISGVRAVDTKRAVSWRQGRLLVSHEPFLAVVDEFNRHSRYKLFVDRNDRRLKEIPISGAITTDRPESLVQYLKDAGHNVWTVKDSSGNIRLRLYPSAD